MHNNLDSKKTVGGGSDASKSNFDSDVVTLMFLFWFVCYINQRLEINCKQFKRYSTTLYYKTCINIPKIKQA